MASSHLLSLRRLSDDRSFKFLSWRLNASRCVHLASLYEQKVVLENKIRICCFTGIIVHVIVYPSRYTYDICLLLRCQLLWFRWNTLHLLYSRIYGYNTLRFQLTFGLIFFGLLSAYPFGPPPHAFPILND